MNISIEVKNPSRVCRGIESLEVDGKKLDSVLVPVDLLHDGSRIIAVMGKNALPVRNQRM